MNQQERCRKEQVPGGTSVFTFGVERDVKCEAWLSILFDSSEEVLFKPTMLLEGFLP